VTTITGVIGDGGKAYGFTLTGNGKLALNNTETYTGPTTNSGGTLLVNGQIGSGNVIVATNGFLGGTGIITGPVTVQAGGGVAPGNLAIGTLTINNSLTLLGGSTNFVKVNKGAGTHDLVVVSGAVAYAGTLVATNLSGNINLTDTFHVFSPGSESGTFTNVVGTPGPGLAWSFNAASGTLSVIQGVNINPTNITFSVSGGNLNLSWPADHLGWSLQVQTNSLAKGISTNWVTVPNSSNVTSTNFPLVSTNGAVFYRMTYP
jgi:autotransporter-associated beta strand protein